MKAASASGRLTARAVVNWEVLGVPFVVSIVFSFAYKLKNKKYKQLLHCLHLDPLRPYSIVIMNGYRCSHRKNALSAIATNSTPIASCIALAVRSITFSKYLIILISLFLVYYTRCKIRGKNISSCYTAYISLIHQVYSLIKSLAESGRRITLRHPG